MSDSSSRDNDNAAIAATLANAQAAVADLADQYIGWVNEDLVRLETVATAATGSTDPDKLTAVYDVAHDIKGQGSTFGYQLVTEIGALLCRYIQDCIKKARCDDGVIAAHIEALHTVVDNRVQGDAGEIGREILAALRGAAQKSLA
ncbi:Hpt domain-containing protein [Ferrovibrio xuzhouensis]|uniref:Hpt domain-containing protein n=1 Tax=Ferrovibrio xuzhouensis TaxID=1576914 RepID=A0ABV7VI43_9PROT